MRGETLDVLGDAAARHRGGQVLAVAAGDVAVICTDVAADIWTIYPVAAVVDDRGVLTRVRGRSGHAVDWQLVADLPTVLCMPASWFRADGLAGLWWRPYRGAAAARSALQTLFRGYGDTPPPGVANQ